MWKPKPGSFHYGRTENDYKHLLALREKYKLRTPPIEELKKACLADGYPPEKVATLKYKKMDDWNTEEIFHSKRKTKQVFEHNVDEKESVSDKESIHSEVESYEDLDDFNEENYSDDD